MDDNTFSDVGSKYYSPKRSYDDVMWRPLGEGIDDAIRRSIDLDIAAEQQVHSGLQKPLEHCCLFVAKSQRQRLHRLLIAMAKWNPHLGFNEEFAVFCAVILAAVGRERAAFSVASGVYEQCQLDDFFVGACPATSSGRDFISGPQEISAQQEVLLERDVEAIKTNVWDSWPGVMVAFSTFGQMARFERLAKSWLKSLLTSGIGQQPLNSFLPLLRRVVSPGPGGLAGRDALGATVAAIFGRQCEAFSAACGEGDEAAFEKAVAALESQILVDQELLDLVDEAHSWSWRALSAFDGATPWIFLLTLGLGLGTL